MREHPWDSRHASVAHHQWFQKLAGLHFVTRSWLDEVGQETPGLWRSAGPEVVENLELLDRLIDPSASLVDARASRLDALLDDTLPEEMLARLERTVRAVQSWSLRSVLERAQKADLPELLDRLEQSCWRSGREWGLKRLPPGASRVNDLREALASLRGAPWFPIPPRQGILVQRAIRAEARFDLLLCPHQGEPGEAEPVADTLCSLLGHWIQGFLNAYDPGARMSYLPLEPPRRPRCEVSWSSREARA